MFCRQITINAARAGKRSLVRLGCGHFFAEVEQAITKMASGEATAITTQPRSRRKEIEQFVRDLDPTQVVGELLSLFICAIIPRSKPRLLIHQITNVVSSTRCTHSCLKLYLPSVQNAVV